MTKASEIMGVHYITSHKCWRARDVHKKTLYRGKDKQAAEQARKAYDESRGKESRKSTVSGVARNSHKKMFDRTFQPDWGIYGKSQVNGFEIEYGR